RLMFQLIDRPVALVETSDPVPLVVTNGTIAFKDVSFAYTEDQPVLTHLDFVIEGGTSCALVGPSGGGKSTIMSLMLRLFDAQSGVIEIDGQDISATNFQSLRDHIAFVSQDTFLFSGTIRENILIGGAEATNDEVVAAAKAANAHEFITAMTDGYDTEVGENGAQLSGGQKQRVAIARAILKNAPIVLLDEATSALDSESEALVKAALDRLLENRTSIIIAHRLSTVRTADMICVVNNGEIVEQGNHAELLNNKTLYSKLHDLQFDTVSGQQDAAE
ncbi:MAG: ABC transporter ATP-binding protein, partial [Hyphomicrobiaceae bacterium]